MVEQPPPRPVAPQQNKRTYEIIRNTFLTCCYVMLLYYVCCLFWYVCLLACLFVRLSVYVCSFVRSFVCSVGPSWLLVDVGCLFMLTVRHSKPFSNMHYNNHLGSGDQTVHQGGCVILHSALQSIFRNHIHIYVYFRTRCLGIHWQTWNIMKHLSQDGVPAYSSPGMARSLDNAASQARLLLQEGATEAVGFKN